LSSLSVTTCPGGSVGFPTHSGVEWEGHVCQTHTYDCLPTETPIIWV
jgi:hypothetical protein